jgi:hypothetical protein
VRHWEHFEREADWAGAQKQTTKLAKLIKKNIYFKKLFKKIKIFLGENELGLVDLRGAPT